MMKYLSGKISLQSILVFTSLILGLGALLISFQAYQVSTTTQKMLIQQSFPNILVVETSGTILGGYGDNQDSRHLICGEGIRLQNTGHSPTSLIGFDVTVIYHDNILTFASDRWTAYARIDSTISPAFTSFNSGIFPDDDAVTANVLTGDSFDAVDFPVQFESLSTKHFFIATHYVVDFNKVQFDNENSDGNSIRISYVLYFASGQSIEIPASACQYIK